MEWVKKGKGTQKEASWLYAQTTEEIGFGEQSSNSTAWGKQSFCYVKRQNQLVLKIGVDDTWE